MAVFDPKYPGERRLQFVILLPTIALTAWWGWSYSGPYKWLASLQINLFGGYHPALTWTLLIVGMLIGELFVIRLLCGYLNSARADIPEHFRPHEITESKPLRRGTPFAMLVHSLPVQCVAVGLGLFAVGAYVAYRLPTMNHLCKMTIDQLAAGVAPDSNWIELEAVAHFDQIVSIKRSINEYYIPLTPATYSIGTPVIAYVSMYTLSITPKLNGVTKFNGIIDFDGLPGMVRSEFESRGFGPASSYMLIEHARTPDDKRALSNRLMIGGIITAFAGALIFPAKRAWNRLRIMQQQKNAA